MYSRLLKPPEARSFFLFGPRGTGKTTRIRRAFPGAVYIDLLIDGMAGETLLFQEIRAINDALDLGYKLYYWRPAVHQEVDFVLSGARGLLAFEIKRTGRIAGTHFRGLRSFLKDYPMAKAYFFYGGRRRLAEDRPE